ncbi:hypothetical protein MMC21_004080 [Puttea exsequens]|nr:hypothetical protein [Puttea exsequens]
MTLPLALAGPAALAGAAYLSARTQIGYDLTLVRGLARSSIHVSLQQRRDRVNQFYNLEKHAATISTANRTFLIYEGKSWTYKEVYDIVLKYGTWLKKVYAIAPKEIVAIDFMNCPQFLFLWLGLWSIGASPAFVNYNLTGDPLLHSLKASNARILFVDPEIKHHYTPKVTCTLASSEAKDKKGVLKVIYFSPSLEEQILNTSPIREPDSSRSANRLDLALLIFTSGTTGLPKAGFVSWRKLLLLESFVPFWLKLKKTDRFYTCMPLYHSSATFNAVIPTLATGCTLILGHRFSTRTFWPEVREHNASIIQYVGETLRYLLAAPPSPLDQTNNVRIAFGNGLRPDVWERFKVRFGIDTIAEFYGATEGVAALWNLSSNAYSSGAIGRNGSLTQLLASLQCAVVEVDWATESPLRSPETGFCTNVPRGKPGELLFSVDPKDIFTKFQGYYGNDAASTSKVLCDVFRKGDAYVRTGDVVRWDEEGRWWFVDRIGDTYRWKSENVSTAEVSAVLGAHPAVVEANVYGVEVPHHDGRAGCAAVLLRKEEGVGEKALLESVAKHAVNGLPGFAVPLFLRIVKSQMATGNGKQQKAVLRGEGVEPGKARERGDRLVWLRGGGYVDFGEREWEELRGGGVKL